MDNGKPENKYFDKRSAYNETTINADEGLEKEKPFRICRIERRGRNIVKGISEDIREIIEEDKDTA